MENWQVVLVQIINGTIDPNWVMTLEMGLIAFLLLRVLNRIEKKQEVHDKQIADLDKDVAIIKNQIGEI